MGSNIYNHTQIEEKWQAVWEEQQLFQGSQQQRTNTQPKSYLLFAFAYPSGSGLHVGHVESKTALDILARHARMHGERVFFPVGWDAFGLPAENYAIKTGVPPAETTRQAINTFRRQLKRIGISYDWANEIATSHPEYYRWTQWIFLQLFDKGLAYQATAPVNWCPSCQTVLANEQVVGGGCERCGADVIQKEMKQWFFKISEYRDELISGLDQVDWPSATKQQQLHWIGKSDGTVVRFQIEDSSIQLECFTTRVDTIYGVSFIAISPEKFEELALSDQVDSQRQQAVQHYLDQAKKKTEEQRKIGEKEKTGVNTGLTAINPVNGEQIPLFIADYVLAGYGTGVVMGVPAHDERDFAFARKYDLPIKEVVQPLSVIQSIQEATGRRIAQGVNATSNLYTTFGALINSGPFSGMTSEEAQVKIPEHFSDAMEQTTTYKLRDWLISRQRYWGAPIPIVYDPEGNAHPVRQEHLPWTLPTDVEFKPTGESPLTHSLELKERVERLYGKGWTPEYDTMDTFVDSSWYYLRYVDARNTQTFASSESLANWLPVDMYMIGPEHIVLHLLYSRFFTKFLRDQGYLTFDEPFLKMRHQGMILGPDGRKMSKSKGNVINPDEVIEKFGADTLRVYEMFMGPIDADKPWNTNSVVGIYRFLSRVYALVTGQLLADGEQLDPQSHQKLHQTISKVSGDISDLKFNTAIAAMMECVNTWEAATKAASGRVLSLEDIAAFVQILSPFAPFLGEELWQLAGNATSVHLSSWPIVDESALSAQECVIVIQVNGKLRDQMVVQADQADDRALLVSLAKQQAKVAQYLSGGTILKEIVVSKKLVNFVLA